MPEPSIDEYTIGWICALQEEYEAACRMLQEEFEGPETSEVNDNNTYVFGRIRGHNIIIGCLPDGRYGNSSAASVARDMVRSFANLRFALMVGIGGGAPTRERDIRLGDVVVSVPQGKLGGVVQYDFGRRLPGGRFERIGQLNAPPEVLLGALPNMRRLHNDPTKSDRVAEHLRRMDDMPGFRRPADDRLYRADYEHKGGEGCGDCEADGLEERPPRNLGREVIVHYGIIATANSVMKDAKIRDEYATDPELTVLCFEMEAGGLMNNFPCLVIRGICDYSDSHKNHEWHNYAARAAAAYARELLHVLKPVKVTTMPSWAGKMETTLADISRQQHNQEEEEILKWLTPIDYAAQQSDYLRSRQPGTGQWLLESAEFRSWLKNDKQTLFCPGIPGAGKTFITSIVVDYLQTNYTKSSIAYLYCNVREQHKQTLENLLKSILKQFARTQPDLLESVKDLHERHKKNESEPRLQEILEILQTIISLNSRAFIIVDALDECQNHDGCRDNLLSQIFALQSKTGLNLFATSRHQEVDAQFSGCISLEIRAMEEDIKSYLNEQIPLWENSNHNTLDDGLRDEIKTEITKAAEGMFLLAYLNMKAIKSQKTKRDIKDALQKLAKGEKELDKAYQKTMERIQGQETGSKKLAEQTLTWIVHAKRPLSTTELLHALAVRPDDTKLDEDGLPTVESLLSVCAGLVRLDEKSEIFNLVHKTTRDYFESTKATWFPDAEREITKTCVTYLSFNTFESGYCQTQTKFEQRLLSNPLYSYAARNWGHHACKASTLYKGVLNFLECEVKTDASSQALMAFKLPSRRLSRMTGLHLAAYFGVHEAANTLIRRSQSLDLKDGYGQTPLLYAAENGHVAVVKLLVEMGANVDSKDECGRTPLFYAAKNEHEAVMELLLKKANVNSEDIHCRTPLSYAAEDGRGVVVKLLVKEGANVDSRVSNFGRTPLSYAAEKGYDAIVNLLLQNGASVDSKDSYNLTPLSYAAKNGHKAVVEFLLEKSATLDSKDHKYGGTPLLYAIEEGHEAIAKLLRDTGANIDSNDEYGRTLLSYAAEEGHKARVELLLNTGANVNSKDKYSRTPLLYAIKNGNEAIVKLLLEQGADVSSRGKYDQTPLWYAIEKGHEAIVKQLLDHGADVGSKNMDGQTPLEYALEEGQVPIAKLLIELDLPGTYCGLQRPNS